MTAPEARPACLLSTFLADVRKVCSECEAVAQAADRNKVIDWVPSARSLVDLRQCAKANNNNEFINDALKRPVWLPVSNAPFDRQLKLSAIDYDGMRILAVVALFMDGSMRLPTSRGLTGFHPD
jgi:hypothetical protein